MIFAMDCTRYINKVGYLNTCKILMFRFLNYKTNKTRCETVAWLQCSETGTNTKRHSFFPMRNAFSTISLHWAMAIKFFFLLAECDTLCYYNYAYLWAELPTATVAHRQIRCALINHQCMVFFSFKQKFKS